MAIYWCKCDRTGVRHPICRPKFMVFLDSQILSGIYFYHWHLINCKILYVIPVLSNEFFAILPYMLKTGNNEKYGFKWPILGPFFALIQKITVIFEIICYFLLSFIHLAKIRPNSHEFKKIDFPIWLCTSNSVFLRVVVTNSPQLIKVRDLNGSHGNQTTF